ncbi:MAG TPA: hypothetical protein PLN61_02950 [bacterium]|nr:hypothetical protein [bacterium]HQI47598.1 hypothetical protein [bacterium]HQJ64375.1 hypothetical protein [bacterium]HQJ65487.1 hypothetical protein [bacterium]
MKKILMTLTALLAAYLTAAASESPPFTWPTDASRLLTSTFGEYRGHRFHAGMDIKTFGQVGYKALAVRPGFVSRVQVSPWGYGRVVFLLLDTGETAVYGHLQKFNPEIARRVAAEQERTGHYAVELRFAPGEIPVAQGEIVGWTGQSGSGAPHLHFELRDAAESPVNPLLKGFEIKDTLAPAVRRVMVIPLDAAARVAGDLEPVVYLPIPAEQGRLRIERTIPVYGRIGFAAEFFDQIDGAQNRMNLYRYRLLIDDKEVFATRYDTYPYEIDRQADLDREYRTLVRDKALFQRFFREAGNTLPFYASEALWYGALECDPASMAHSWLTSITRALGFFWDLPAGVTILEKGIHLFRIEARDFSGNCTTVEGRLQAGPPEAVRQPETGGLALDKAGYTIDADYYDAYVRLTVAASQPVRQIPGLQATWGDGHQENLLLARSGRAGFRSGLTLYPNHPGPVRLRLFDPETGEGKVLHEVMLQYVTVREGREKIFVTQDGLCELFFDKASLFKSISVRARTRNRGAEKLPLASKIYQIDPVDVPLSGMVTVRIHVEDTMHPEQVALYRRAPGGDWQYLGREAGSGGSVGSRSRELGEFALIRDSEPPAITALLPAEGARTTRTPLLQARVHDALSGIGDEEQYELRLDGRPVIVEYDPEGERLLHPVATPLRPGRHTLELTVSDRCGNRAGKAQSFYVR